MKVIDLDFLPIIREVYAAHVIGSSMGVPMENIFVVPEFRIEEGDEAECGVKLVQESPEINFWILVGPIGMPVRDFVRQWVADAERINRLDPEDRAKVAEGTETMRKSVEILAAMVLSGFERRVEE